MKKVRDPRTGAWVCSRSIWAWPLLALALVLCASPALAQTRIAPPGVSSSAPIDAQYWVGAADATLTQEKNLGALATGLIINTAGTPSIYAGTSCANQFPRSLNASAAAACASVAIGSDVSGLGANVATFLGTPSSANLAAAVTGETGSGGLVFDTSPTLVAPNLGTPSAVVLTNATGFPYATGGTGILPAANMTCHNPASYCFFEDFAEPVMVSTDWLFLQFGAGGGGLSILGGTSPNIGQLVATTNTLAGDGLIVTPQYDFNTTLLTPGINLQAVPWSYSAIFKLSSTASVAAYVGIHDGVLAPTASIPANGCFLRYDTALSDTTWVANCRSGGTSSTQTWVNSGGSALDTAFHKVTIASTVAGTVTFSMCDAAGANCNSTANVTTNVPTNPTAINNILTTKTVAAKVLTLDYISFVLTGLAR